MKTFKQLISEVQQPKSEGEQNFKGLHNPINHKDLVPGVTDQEHVFNGSPQRKDPKTASYEDDASEKAYDKTLKVKDTEEKKKGSQTDLNIEEESELDEGKYNWDKEHRRGVNDTMGNRMLNKRAVYPSRKPPADVVKKEDEAIKKFMQKKGMKEETIEEKTLTSAEMRKREEIVKSLKKKGMEKSKAYAIATATAKRVAEENLDELSKQTLGSYINKAASSAAKSSYKIMKDKPENAAKHGMDSFKRLEGIKKATAKMAEESEQIDELSSKTVMSYGIKATAEIGKGNLSPSKESKRMAGTKMADEKMRKKEGKSSMAKVAAEEFKIQEGARDPDKHYAKLSQERKDAVNRQLRNGKSYWEAVRAVMKLHKEEQDLEEARRGRPRKDGSKPEGDEEGGREHIIMQLRKVVNLRGQKKVEFNDDSKHDISVDHAKKALAKHDSMHRAADKQAYAEKLAKSHSSFKSTVSEAVVRNHQDINPESGSADSTTMHTARGAMKTFTTVDKEGRVQLVKHREHRKEIKIGESVEMNPKNAEKMIKHDCAKHVLHKEWGEGETVEGMHTIVETAEGEGYVTHYDVMFAHGIEQNIPVEDLEIMTMVEHWHKNYKPKGKMSEAAEGTHPKTEKHKKLAAFAHPKEKITHKDVLVGRGVIKNAVKEAVNMQKDSLVKLKKDPAAGDNIKTDLPPTQGNKPIGGEGETSRVGGKYSVEEEKLMKLYDSLSEENKSVFESLIESEGGIDKLLAFAEEQGF